jgi:putative ABC transport system ATP-binding protein
MSRIAAIMTEGLTRRYVVGGKEILAVDDVDIVVERGEFISIMGPSGSGKSTLLHLIGCIDRQTSGRIMIEGVDTLNLSERQLDELRLHKIGFVFQTFNLLPTLTAFENVSLPLELAGVGRRESSARVLDLLSMVGLSGRSEHIPAKLSVGERQRVGIARALANDPAIILADEPTGNLDSSTAMGVVEILKKLNREAGKTIVLVTHNSEVGRSAQRALRLKDGRLVAF